MSSCSHLNDYLLKKGTTGYRLISAYFVTCIAKGSRKKKVEECYCYECSERSGRIHACLECIHFGCFDARHIHKHSKKLGHPLAVDLIVGAVYCFTCEDYIYNSKLETISKQDRLLEAKIYGTDLYSLWDPSTEICKVEQKNGRKISMNKPYLGVRGLTNLGNTCYLNCIIQVITHTPLLKEYFLCNKHICRFEDKDDCLLCELSHIYQQLYCGKTNVFHPCRFLFLIWKVEHNLASSGQQDVLEIYLAVINLLCMHFKGVAEKSSNDPFDCECIFHRVFTGLLLRVDICSKCIPISISSYPEFFCELSLELDMKTYIKNDHPGISLVDCLERFTQQKTSKKMCPGCGGQVQEQTTIKVLPNVICFHLNRLERDFKFEAHILFDEYIDMEPFMSFKCSTQCSETHDTAHRCLTSSDLRFCLFAVIEHIGNDKAGHYVSYVKLGDKKWYFCNDPVIEQVDIDKVLKSQGYLLFYHKQILEYK